MGAELRRDPVRVVVPASSANLGPGFDAVGLGLDIWDSMVAMATDDPGMLIEVEGEGADEVPRDDRHLVAQAMALALDAVDVRPTGLVLRCTNVIPHRRGIGSSASAIVGGLVLGRALLVDGADLLSDDDLLQLATRMESHPDNTSASLFGGLTLGWVDDAGRAGAARLDVHPSIVPVLAIPGEEVPTSEARAVLPECIPMDDVVHNISRAALLGQALTRQPELLMAATSDRLHQERRRPMYAASMALVERLRARGVPAVISGAGPTVLAFASEQTVDVMAELADPGWDVRPTAVATRGAHEVPVHPGNGAS